MQEAYDFLNNKAYIEDNDNIVVAVSGGPDSMALLDLMVRVKQNKNIKVICAHVNHNLRKESAEEKIMVENYCIKNNIIFEYMKIDKYGDDNFHNEARTIRYNYFNEIVKKYKAKYLLTAHHGDDLMETILMRIVRGSTLKGYSGFSKIVKMDTYLIVRPLIGVIKKEIEEYCNKNNIKYAIDKSNYKDVYTRNRYRKYILPHLKDEDRDVHKKFYKFSRTLLEYNDYIDKVVKEKLKEICSKNILDIEKWNLEEHVIKMKIIYSMLESYYQDDLMLITDKHAELIYELIISDKSNIIMHLPNNVIAVKSYNTFYLTQKEEKKEDYEIEIIDYVNLPNGHNIEVIESTKENGNDICRLSYKDVTLPLYVRNRKRGDRINIKGMLGSKKIKDIFIDEKIDILERDLYPVVVDAKENIVWLPGLKKSKFNKSKEEKCDIILKYY